MALEGTLSYMDIEHLLKVVESSRKSGVLEISWQDREARLFLQEGRLVRAESNRNHDGIGTLLVRSGILREEQLEQALALQREEGGRRRLGAILCDEFGVSAADTQRLLCHQFEAIVYDVFSWPGGSFVFHIQEAEQVLDRFHLAPVEFLLQVGIQAGLLAQEGAQRERTDPHGNPPPPQRG